MRGYRLESFREDRLGPVCRTSGESARLRRHVRLFRQAETQLGGGGLCESPDRSAQHSSGAISCTYISKGRLGTIIITTHPSGTAGDNRLIHASMHTNRTDQLISG